MDLALVKTIAEVAGVGLTMLAVALMGRPGRVQRWGIVINLVSIVPWTIFSVLTSSWVLLGQGAVIGVVSSLNLRNLIKRGSDADAA